MIRPPFYAHIRDILLLPFSVTVIFPFLIIKNTHEVKFCNTSFLLIGLLFYLAGLLYEHRGNSAVARGLFEASAREDPTLHWPAYLAKQRLLKKG